MTKLIFLLPIVGALLFGAAILRGDETASAQVGPCETSNAAITQDEADMLTLVNNWRASNLQAPPMTMSESASKAAQWHAEAMTRGETTGHTDMYGRTWIQRLIDCGYPAQLAPGSGEAYGNFQSAEAALNWMIDGGDPNHLSGIEARVGWACAGVGYAYNPTGTFKHMWVVVVAQAGLGDPCPDPITVSNPPTATPTIPPPTFVPPTATVTSTEVPPTATPTESVYRSFAPGAATDD